MRPPASRGAHRGAGAEEATGGAERAGARAARPGVPRRRGPEAMEQEKYLPELMAEKDSLDPSFVHAMRLLADGKTALPPAAAQRPRGAPPGRRSPSPVRSAGRGPPPWVGARRPGRGVSEETRVRGRAAGSAGRRRCGRAPRQPWRWGRPAGARSAECSLGRAGTRGARGDARWRAAAGGGAVRPEPAVGLGWGSPGPREPV